MIRQWSYFFDLNGGGRGGGGERGKGGDYIMEIGGEREIGGFTYSLIG